MSLPTQWDPPVPSFALFLPVRVSISSFNGRETIDSTSYRLFTTCTVVKDDAGTVCDDGVVLWVEVTRTHTGELCLTKWEIVGQSRPHHYLVLWYFTIIRKFYGQHSGLPLMWSTFFYDDF